MKKSVPALAGLVCLGMFAGPVYGEETLQSRQNALTQRFTALVQDANSQRDAFKSVENRLSGVTKDLAPLMRVCMQTGAALQPSDVDNAEKNAAAVEAQLKDALSAARACKSPEALKAARTALTEAIDQTAAIERLTYTGAVGPGELGAAQSKIPESLTALAELSAAWNDARTGYKGFADRAQAYQRDAAAYNTRREVQKGDAAQAPPLPLEGFQAQYDELERSVGKISAARAQLDECRHANSGAVPGALSARVESARKNAAQAFAVYGQDITKDSANCQTRLETKAAPGDAVKLAEASGRPQTAPAEPPPPKASPVTPVASDTLPLIPGTKEKPKRVAKKTMPVVVASKPQGVTVSAMSGFATTEEGSNSFGLTEGQTVAVGAGIETKPSSKVRLGGGAQTIDIGADTRVRMPSSSSRLLKLEAGGVDMNQDATAMRVVGAPDVDGIETAQGVITGQGRYRVTADQGQTAVEVLEGRVHVAGTYVLKLPPKSEENSAQKLAQTPVEDIDLGPGERAILLRVRQPATTVTASAETNTAPAVVPTVAEPPVVAMTDKKRPAKAAERKVAKAEEPKKLAATEPPQKPPVRQADAKATRERKIPGKETGKEKEAPAKNEMAKTEVARAVPPGPKLPGFLSARPAASVATAAVATPSLPEWAAPDRTVDPIEEARAQLDRQRKLDSDRGVVAQRETEIREAEQRRLAQEREQERQLAEQPRAEEPAALQNARDTITQQDVPPPTTGNIYDRAGQASPYMARTDFAGSWRCRVSPSSQRRFGTMQSQIVIRATSRGYDAVADGQRIPAVSVRGSRIHFAQSVASNDGRYYGSGIDLDLQDEGTSLVGSGRVKISDGYNIQDVPASLFCERVR